MPPSTSLGPPSLKAHILSILSYPSPPTLNPPRHQTHQTQPLNPNPNPTTPPTTTLPSSPHPRTKRKPPSPLHLHPPTFFPLQQQQQDKNNNHRFIPTTRPLPFSSRTPALPPRDQSIGKAQLLLSLLLLIIEVGYES